MGEEIALLCLTRTLVTTNGEAEIKIQEAVLTRMEACAEHVQYQFPCQHSRVGFLLDAIQSNDAGLQAAIVRTDDGPNGMRNDFEGAATHLLPYDPVAKKRLSGTKRGAGMTSSVMDLANGCPMSARRLLAP
jgi:hypothetical protein